MLRIIRSCLLLFFALCAGSVQAAAAPGRIVVFGDSLSDPGNYYAAFGTLSLPPYAPLPDSPYAIGRAHYSNGPTWIEQLADTLDRSGDARPALRHSAHAANYAVGRARARAAAAA
ncbi:MAG: SGNH/GDSL hydrolase family protein, partial [Proteobacteria bacterium]|nr:SGNH/GDSL hydrolase family protein [Pseudomonadota bacterium]